MKPNLEKGKTDSIGPCIGCIYLMHKPQIWGKLYRNVGVVLNTERCEKVQWILGRHTRHGAAAKTEEDKNVHCPAWRVGWRGWFPGGLDQGGNHCVWLTGRRGTAIGGHQLSVRMGRSPGFLFLNTQCALEQNKNRLPLPVWETIDAANIRPPRPSSFSFNPPSTPPHPHTFSHPFLSPLSLSPCPRTFHAQHTPIRPHIAIWTIIQ